MRSRFLKEVVLECQEYFLNKIKIEGSISMRTWISKLMIFCGVFILTIYAHADLNLDGLVISDSQLEEIKSKAMIFETDRSFYHWASIETALQWTGQTDLAISGIRTHEQPTFHLKNYGSGFFLAEAPTSSASYGDVPLLVTVKRGTLIFDDRRIQQLLNKQLTLVQIEKLAEALLMVRNPTGDWWVVYSPEVIFDMKFAVELPAKFSESKKKGLLQSPKVERTLPVFKTLWTGIQNTVDGRFVERFLHLAHFLDGLSLLRAVKLNERNPWQGIPSDAFERYLRAHQKLIMASIVKNEKALGRQIGEYSTSSIVEKWKTGEVPVLDTLGSLDDTFVSDLRILNDKKFGYPGMDPKQWVKYQINDLLPKLNRAISGHFEEENVYRRESLRRGNIATGSSLHLPIVALLQLLQNPYIEVNYVLNPDKKTASVEYFHPDVFHYKKVKSLLSQGLVGELERQTPESLMAYPSVRARLNSQLVEELLGHAFRVSYGQSADLADLSDLFNLSVGNVVHLYKDLVSIQPFQTDNDLTLRFFFEATQLQQGLDSPSDLVNDFVLFFSMEEYQTLLLERMSYMARLRGSLIKELLTSRAEGRPIRLSLVPELQRIENAFSRFGIQNSLTIGRVDANILGAGDWNSYLSRILGEKWPINDMPTILSAMNHELPDNLIMHVLKSVKFSGANHEQFISLLEEFQSSNLETHLLFLYSTGSAEMKNAVVKYLEANHGVDKQSKQIKWIFNDYFPDNPIFEEKDLAISEIKSCGKLF